MNKFLKTILSIIVFIFGIYWLVIAASEISFLMATIGILCILMAYVIDKEEEE